jgi:hypothetical protein
MPNLDATMLWLNQHGSRYAVKKFVKEGSATGRKYVITINGQWLDIDAFLEEIIRGDSTNRGYSLERLLAAVPNFSAQAKDILIPPGVQAFARTPRLESTGEGDKADLTLIFEEGLQENTGGAGGFPVGPNLTDAQAFSEDPSNNVVPANTTYRLVFEPSDVDLAYGLPFRKGYKWDLTVQAPNLNVYTFDDAPAVEDSSGAVVPGGALKPYDLLKNLGYKPGSISTLAVCNIWRDGALTEPQRGALFSYLNDGGDAAADNNEDTAEGRTSRGMRAYVRRILRGETSYRYYIPHVSVTRRYRSPPVVPGYFPLPGEIAEVGAPGAPPAWTNAPTSMFVPGSVDDPELAYSYLSTGPQVDFVGDQWQVDVQWSAFVDLDTNLYENPKTIGDDPGSDDAIE